MDDKKFIDSINNLHVLSQDYRNEPLVGLIQIWKHADKIVLTWEECKDGNQRNEYLYTRDVHMKFEDTNELFEYLKDNGLSVENFDFAR
ncbi:MAG: hypothetical protein R3C11_28305 [Planctomycetaceae bacterium]